MAGVGSRSHDEINTILKKLIPELDSEYARYPMSYSRWLTLREKGPKGEPTWIKSDNVGVKKHYIYGRGPGGPAYFHLLTKTAYVLLYTKISHSRPDVCCACWAEDRKKFDEWDRANRILHARYVSSVPNDAAAFKAQIEAAQAVAKIHYDAGQNEQILLGG